METWVKRVGPEPFDSPFDLLLLLRTQSAVRSEEASGTFDLHASLETPKIAYQSFR